MIGEAQVPGDWLAARDRILARRGLVLVVGEPDVGKTTFSRWLLEQSHQRGLRSSYLDADPGQSSLGPPCAFELAVVPPTIRTVELAKLPVEAAVFLGSTSPQGHVVETLVGLSRLVDRSREIGAEVTVIDPTSYNRGEEAVFLKHEKIRLVAPAHLVVLERERELEAIVLPHERRKFLEIHRLSPAPGTVGRSLETRARNRHRSYAEYFSRASKQRLEEFSVTVLGRGRLLPPAEMPDDVLVGLEGDRGFLLALGVVRRAPPPSDKVGGRAEGLQIETPLERHADARVIRVGSIHLNDRHEEMVTP